jgi:RNA polymerase sigma-70 factor (ECF subfamily)
LELETDVKALLASGDVRTAATRVLRELGPSVLRYLRSLLHDETDATEAFSQFAENVWHGLPEFRGASSLRTWCFRIAWNAAQNQRDEAWRRRARPFATGEASAIADQVRTRTVVRLERQRDALDQLRESLTPEERSLLSLRIDQQLSWAEIAVVLAGDGPPASADTVSKRFERLKERLARMAREKGLIG